MCICGAHWCYYCQKSTHDCDGACAEYGDRSEDENEFDEEEDDIATSDVSQEEPLTEDEGAEPLPVGDATNQAKLDGKAATDQALPIQAPLLQALPAQTPPIQPSDTALRPATQRRDDSIVNLDAGGARRWAETELDFGEEPEEETYDQIWSCRHRLEEFQVVMDGFDHGDLGKMECNRCFTKVSPRPPAATPRKQTVSRGRAKAPGVTCPSLEKVELPTSDEGDAIECTWCRLILCRKCQVFLDKINAERLV